MINPRDLGDTTTTRFDPDLIVADYDDDEPLELERVGITAADAEHLRNVPLSANTCTFVDCDLSVFTFVSVRNTLFSGSKMRGTRFIKSLLNVVFDTCVLNECTFRMITMKRTTFDQSQLVDCDFYGSSLETLAFPATSIKGVGFDQCTIDGLDLSESTDLMIGDPRTLRGASIDESHVPLIALRLAQLSGIDVREAPSGI